MRSQGKPSPLKLERQKVNMVNIQNHNRMEQKLMGTGAGIGRSEL